MAQDQPDVLINHHREQVRVLVAETLGEAMASFLKDFKDLDDMELRLKTLTQMGRWIGLETKEQAATETMQTISWTINGDTVQINNTQPIEVLPSEPVPSTVIDAPSVESTNPAERTLALKMHPLDLLERGLA